MITKFFEELNPNIEFLFKDPQVDYISINKYHNVYRIYICLS